MIIDFEKENSYKYPVNMNEIDSMTGTEFELFIFHFLKEYQGYSVEITEEYDFGIDIIAIKDDRRFGIQCKRFGPNTTLEENHLEKMEKGVKRYGISQKTNGRPYLIVFTTVPEDQVSKRGRLYVINNDIQMFYRAEIVNILKLINENLNRKVNSNDYENIAFDTTKQNKGSYKQNNKMVEFLKEERKKITQYNKINQAYLVYTDKTIGEIIENKPTTIDELKNIKGLSDKNIELFGKYLVNSLNKFYKYEFPELYIEEDNNTQKEYSSNNSNEETDEKFVEFLKDIRKKISDYNNLTPIYLVFSNDTLDEIAKVKPSTIEELKAIKGFGDKKCDLFGEYLIKEINRFLKNSK